MSRAANYDRYRTRKEKSVVDSPREARLHCGHTVTAFPVASIGDKRYFDCPRGCGLQLAYKRAEKREKKDDKGT